MTTSLSAPATAGLQKRSAESRLSELSLDEDGQADGIINLQKKQRLSSGADSGGSALLLQEQS